MAQVIVAKRGSAGVPPASRVASGHARKRALGSPAALPASARCKRGLIEKLVLSLLLALLLAPPVVAMPSVMRVRLLEAHGDLKSIQLRGPLEIVSPVHKRFGREKINVAVHGETLQMRLAPFSHGQVTHPFMNGRRIVLESRSLSGVSLTLVSLGKYRYGEQLQRSYRGRLIISVNQATNSLMVVNEVPAIEYVASVVGSEAPPHAPKEALKAFAILASMLAERKAEGELIGDSTKVQAYKGCQHATPEIVDAVKAVWNKKLKYEDSFVRPYYHSTCAGGTSSGETIFGEDAKGLRYLQSVPCVYCKKSPFWKSRETAFPQDVFKKIFEGGIPVVTKYDTAKRPLEVELQRPGLPAQHLRGYEAWLKIGRSRGWAAVPGTRFQIHDGGNLVRVTSTGAGHGVGLCQWGAIGLAMQGKQYDEILTFYFPGSHISQ